MTDTDTDLPHQHVPHRFKLVRTDDASGVSGTGVVAVGIEFGDGSVIMQWLNAMTDVETARDGWAIYPSNTGTEDVISVHGHQGRTTIEWIDAPGEAETD